MPEDEGNTYILTLACVNDFINRLLDAPTSNDHAELIKTMAHVLTVVAAKKSHITTTGLKEIVLNEQTMELPDIYFKIRKIIENKTPKIAQKLAMDISAI